MTPESGGSVADWLTDIRTWLIALVTLVNIGAGAMSWMSRDQAIEELRRRDRQMLRVLRSLYRATCQNAGNPPEKCRRRIDENPRLWPGGSSVRFRWDTAQDMTAIRDEGSG